MKRFSDYVKQYNEVIKGATPDKMVVKRAAYILMAWGEDNNVSPWQPEYARKLEEVKATDPRLYIELADGMEIFLNYADADESEKSNITE